MKNKNIFVLMLTAIWLYGCQYDTQKEDPCKLALQDSVSFKGDLLPIFQNNCATGFECHAGQSPAGGLNLEASQAYSNLTRPKSGYVDTINPSRSLLYAALISVTQPMPPYGKLDDCSIEQILKWMDDNAKNN
ncbi:MAG: hypothetical protein J7604_01950 [Sporocytophaga sp.]|uniref:hypothetical protein n=1 Tax=Sporocytophaga sp. TaxID=2231183 RepID=UPI001B160245|nr:hypothetical protein [Sporocytophaga sp.]MBO9698938.1 hypothetical protein [Sporocytophaga sp.]